MNAVRYDLTYRHAEADTIMDTAIVEIRKRYQAENPITIIMDTRVNPYRKNRFNLMRKQRVFLTKVKSSKKSSRRKPGQTKQTSASCRTTKKLRG